MATEPKTSDGRVHKHDIFEPGDRVPYRGGYATVTGREVYPTFMDAYDELHPQYDIHEHPQSEYTEEECEHVVVTLDTSEVAEHDTDKETAHHLATSLSERYDEIGRPSVRAEAAPGVGMGGGVGVSTPATTTYTLSAEEAEQLAALLRALRSCEPLYALLGSVDSPEGVVELADALDRAADVDRWGGRIDR